MGIYVCYRDALEKVGMHNPEIDLHAQDLDTILRFEMAGYRPVVAMDSLVEHYGGTGHQTLDVIASDGTSDYDFRSIRAYDVIYGYIYRPENVLRIKELHPLLVNALDKWRKEYWNDTNGVFNFEKRELYNKWVEWHRDEWKNGSLEKLKKKVEIIVYE
jgi:hypothetical protein